MTEDTLSMRIDEALLQGTPGTPGAAEAASPDPRPSASGDLRTEWERVEWLIHCLALVRAGKQPGEEVLARIKDLQARVWELRAGPSHWDRLDAQGLGELEFDILACVLGAEAHPRIAWMLESLKGAGSGPYPTPALLQGLLALDADETPDLYRALSPASPLLRRRLLELDGKGPLASIVPGPGMIARLLGLAEDLPAPPGSVRVRIQAAWDDLVLPPDRLRLLQEFLMWIRHKRRVEREWGARATGGPVMLLSGPSGTGKTFAAAAIAHALGWPLYRVDLGLLVSKYIGETEKNLNRLFDAAHGRQLVLQFDEADSLMGKRGEVKEARDRYANMEVSHLLSRMEEHDGPCILTTNLRDQLDSAFFRRFHVVAEFPRPDADDRARLWQRLLPPRIPRDPGLDVEAIARAVSLAGGNIRNAALYASCLAADAGEALSMRHVAWAVWREINKDGAQHSHKDLGPLAAHLQGAFPEPALARMPPGRGAKRAAPDGQEARHGR